MNQRPPDDRGPQGNHRLIDLDFHIQCIKRARRSGVIDGAVAGGGLALIAVGIVFLLIKI